MTEHTDHADLVVALESLAPQLAAPGRDLTPAVRSGIDRHGHARPGWWRAAAAAIVLVVAGLAVAFSPVGEAVADWLGIGAVRITRGDPPAAEAVRQLDLGNPTTIDAAATAVAYPLLMPDPERYGDPDAVHFAAAPDGGAVSLVYGPRRDLPAGENGIGLLMMQFTGDLETALYEKVLGPETTLEPIEVRGRRGFWIEGAPHAIVFFDATGGVGEDAIRLAANTLVWEEAGVTVRLEAPADRETMLEVAQGLTPPP